MQHRFFVIGVNVVMVLALGACGNIRDARREEIKVSQPDLAGNAAAPPPATDPASATAPLAAVESAPAAAIAGGVRPAHDFPPPTDRDLRVITDKMDRNVELYDLDSDAPRAYGAGRPDRPPASDGGIPSSADPSVIVYPLDGEYPASAQWPNSMLPTGNMGGTGDARYARSSSATSPRVGSGYTPSQIFFKHGSSRLGSGDKQVLDKVADQARFSPVDRISVEGHASKPTGVADPVEAKIVNLKQSMDRAFNVSSQLMRKGVPAEKIKTTVWGDTNNAGGSEAENRRVDIVTGAQ